MSKSIYPSIPSPGNDMPSLQATLGAMRQSLNMLILNAQNPNPNFSPSAASQIFVTHDQLQKLAVTGQPGPAGPPGQQGLPGPAGQPGASFPEAPIDGNTYGRHNATWVQALSAATPQFSVMPPDAANDAAAALLGVPVRGIYKNGSQLMIRVV